jgi:hypothetical protein
MPGGCIVRKDHRDPRCDHQVPTKKSDLPSAGVVAHEKGMVRPVPSLIRLMELVRDSQA